MKSRKYVATGIIVGILLITVALVSKLERKENKEVLTEDERINTIISQGRQDLEIFEFAPFPTTIFFGENNQNMYISQKERYGMNFEKNKEVITLNYGLVQFNKNFLVQKKYKKRNLSYEKHQSIVDEYILAISRFDGTTVVENYQIDLLSLVEDTEKLLSYVPYRTGLVTEYQGQNYIDIGLMKNNEGTLKNDGKEIKRDYLSYYLNLNTGKLGNDPSILDGIKLKDRETVWDFFKKTNFLEKWLGRYDSVSYIQDDSGYVKLIKNSEINVENLGLYDIHPDIKETFMHDQYTEIHFKDIKIEEMISYLVPKGKDPFKDAGEIHIKNSDIQIESMEDVKRYYLTDK